MQEREWVCISVCVYVYVCVSLGVCGESKGYVLLGIPFYKEYSSL